MEPIRLFALILLLVGSGLPLAGHAGAESGIYIGAGAGLQIARIAGSIEYEYYDQSNFDDVSMASLSLLYTF